MLPRLPTHCTSDLTPRFLPPRRSSKHTGRAGARVLCPQRVRLPPGGGPAASRPDSRLELYGAHDGGVVQAAAAGTKVRGGCPLGRLHRDRTGHAHNRVLFAVCLAHARRRRYGYQRPFMAMNQQPKKNGGTCCFHTFPLDPIPSHSITFFTRIPQNGRLQSYSSWYRCEKATPV
jgi:hypothetical protein